MDGSFADPIHEVRRRMVTLSDRYRRMSWATESIFDVPLMIALLVLMWLWGVASIAAEAQIVPVRVSLVVFVLLAIGWGTFLGAALLAGALRAGGYLHLLWVALRPVRTVSLDEVTLGAVAHSYATRSPRPRRLFGVIPLPPSAQELASWRAAEQIRVKVRELGADEANVALLSAACAWVPGPASASLELLARLGSKDGEQAVRLIADLFRKAHRAGTVPHLRVDPVEVLGRYAHGVSEQTLEVIERLWSSWDGTLPELIDAAQQL